jgi:hypothetical protein
MAKSRKTHSRKGHSRKNFVKTLKTTTKKVIPVVNSGLKTVGKTVKKSAPVVEKGIAGVYGALATGFDMGIKGVKHISKSYKKKHGKKRG